VNVLPRGSGNKAFARKLARAFKADCDIGPYVNRVVIGSSSVLIYLRRTPALDLIMLTRSLAIHNQRAEAANLASHPMLPGFSPDQTLLPNLNR